MEYQFIKTESAGSAGVIIFNRAAEMNALTTAMLQEIVTAAENFDAREDVRAVILRGNDQAFLAGFDLKEIGQRIQELPQMLDEYRGLLLRLRDIRKPMIAAAAGYVLGIGIEILTACDIVLAADNVWLGIPEAGLGIIPGIGLLPQTIQKIGKAKAMEMFLCGRAMAAEEAEHCGLISRLVPLAMLADEAEKTANKIAENPELAVTAIKETVKAAENPVYESGIDDVMMRNKIIAASDDFKNYLNKLSKYKA